MSGPRTLVVGATGALGLKICEGLAGEGGPVRALVRPGCDAGRRSRLLELGIELAEGDLERPETLAPALVGVDRVVTTASAFPVDQRLAAIDLVDRAGSIALVDAAAAAGVGRFVYTSFRPIPFDFPFQRAKRDVEARLAGSGLEFAILQPASFMEVWFSPLLGFDVPAGRVNVYGPGTARLSWISSDDVAAFAIWALSAEAARNSTLPLGGPEALSQLDAIAIHEEVVGRRFERTAVPLEQLEEQLETADTPTGQSLAAVMLEVTHGGVTETSSLAASSGIRLTSVRELAERAHGGSRGPA